MSIEFPFVCRCVCVCMWRARVLLLGALPASSNSSSSTSPRQQQSHERTNNAISSGVANWFQYQIAIPFSVPIFSLFSGRRFARHPCRLFSMLSTEQHLGWPFPIAIICFFIRFRVRHIMICLFFFHSIVCVVARQTQITDAGTHTTRPLSTWWICLALSVYLSHHHIIAIWEMLMTHAIAVPGDQHSTAGWFECENTWRSQIIRQWWWQTHNVYLFVVVHSWLNCV